MKRVLRDGRSIVALPLAFSSPGNVLAVVMLMWKKSQQFPPTFEKDGLAVLLSQESYLSRQYTKQWWLYCRYLLGQTPLAAYHLCTAFAPQTGLLLKMLMKK